MSPRHAALFVSRLPVSLPMEVTHPAFNPARLTSSSEPLLTVSMSSVAGLRGGTGRAAYGASKGGVAALTRVMAVEWAPFGVTVNTLAPGPVETALVKRMHDEETRRSYLDRVPVNRYGAPEEVAAAALYLALPESGYINGVTLPVDGGFDAAGVLKRGPGGSGTSAS